MLHTPLPACPKTPKKPEKNPKKNFTKKTQKKNPKKNQKKTPKKTQKNLHLSTCTPVVHTPLPARLPACLPVGAQISGARVKLHDLAEGSSERIVELWGAPEQLQAARALLQAFILSGGGGRETSPNPY